MTDVLAVQRALLQRVAMTSTRTAISGPETLKVALRAGAFTEIVLAALLTAITAKPASSAGMKVSAAGRAAIAQREGNKLTAYQDSVGIWTVGVGHTAVAGEPKPAKGMKITAAESDAILARDLGDVERSVLKTVTVPLSQNEFDALVSLVFNIGCRRLLDLDGGSTAERR